MNTEIDPSDITALPIAPDPLLGSPIANHPSDRLRLLVIAGLIGGVAAVVLNFTTAEVEGWGPPLTFLLMAALGLGLGWYVLHGWNREIILYERGFSYREGGAFVYFTYDEVRGVTAQIGQQSYLGGRIRRIRHRFTLTTHSGDQFTITDLYRRAGALGAELSARVEATIRATLPDCLARGERILFGERLAVTATGLVSLADRVTGEPERALPWGEYGSYRVAQRQLDLLDTQGESWLKVPLNRIENVALLVRLLREQAHG